MGLCPAEKGVEVSGGILERGPAGSLKSVEARLGIAVAKGDKAVLEEWNSRSS